MDEKQIKAMAIPNLQAKIVNAQQAGDSQQAAEYRRQLAVVAGAARDEQRAEASETARSMQYKFSRQ